MLGRCIHCEQHEKCAIWVNEGDLGTCKNFKPVILKTLTLKNMEFQIRKQKPIGTPSVGRCGDVVVWKKYDDGEFHITRINAYDVESAESWITDAVNKGWEY